MQNMRLLFLILVTVISTSASMAQSEGEVIRIVSDEWCPYTCDAKNRNQGVLIDIISNIFAEHNIKVEYYNNIWSLALEDTKQGYADAIAGTSKTGMQDFIFPDIQQANTISYFYTMPNTLWKYRNGSNFKKITLGAVDGYSYGENIDQYIADNIHDHQKIVLIKHSLYSVETLHKLAINGRIDAFIEDPIVLEYYLANNPESIKLKISGLAESGMQEDNKIYIAFSPKNESSQRYAKILSDGIIKIKKNNGIKNIIEKYGLTYWNW